MTQNISIKQDVEDEKQTQVDHAEPSASDLRAISKSESKPLTKRSAKEKTFDATQLYLGEIGASPLLTAEEEVYFTRKARKGCEKSRARMIESNLRLVVKIARRYSNR